MNDIFNFKELLKFNRCILNIFGRFLLSVLFIGLSCCCFGQTINGESEPVAGLDYVYTLNTNISNAVWNVTGGTVLSSSSTQATIRFNQPLDGPESFGTAYIEVTGTYLSAELDVMVTAGLSAASLDGYPSSITPGNTVELYADIVYGAAQYAFSYQWQVSYNEGYTWSTFASNSSPSHTSPSLAESALFRVIVDGGINVITTNTFAVEVAPPIIPGAMEPDVSLAPYGGNSMDTLKAQPSTGGSSTITYQWQDSSAATNSEWVDIAGATTLKYLPVNITRNHWYRLKSTSGAQSAYSITSHIDVIPAEPSNISSAYNYIITQKGLAPESDSAVFTTRPLSDAPMTIQYFDGLGRPTQTIQKKSSLNSRTGTTGDIVSLHLYDGYGRDSAALLPYVATTKDGSYKIDALSKQPAFYNSINSPDSGQGENGLNARSIPLYEQSPLSRPLESFAPGDSWAGTAGQGSPAARHSVKHHYAVNTVKDSVRIWQIGFQSTPGAGLSTPTSTGYYSAGTLYKTVLIDEAGHQEIEYKNKSGQVILKKVQLTAASDDGSGSTPAYEGWLCTYYIFDNLGDLRCVIQPDGVAAMAHGSWVLSSTLLAQQCFRYEYDSKGRMVIKQLPGAGAVYMAYDARNRLVMTQDADMRPSSLWIGTKYDNFNRIDSTWLDSLPGVTFTSILSAASSSESYRTADITAANLLTATHYDDYSGIAMPTGLSASYKSTWTSYLMPASNNTFPYAQLPQQITATTPVNTKGKVTWTRTKVLDVSPLTFITTINIYDKKGRVIQTQKSNITGGLTIYSTQYSWSGQPLVSINWQSKLGTRPDTAVLVTKISYDKLWRPIKTEIKQTDSRWGAKTMPSSYTTLSTQQYGSLGQLKKLYLGHRRSSATTYSTTPLESQYYEYNARGWLLGINRPYVRDAGSMDSTTTTISTLTVSGEMFTESSMDVQSVSFPATHYFGFDLGYDKVNNNLIQGKSYLAAQYTGNITGMVWKTANDQKVRKYDFTYDKANRLTTAAFGQYKAGGFSTANVNYSVSNLSYDHNGNMLTMNQYGLKSGSTSALIDQLTYHYNTSSNQLKNVVDASNDASTTLGDFHYTGTKAASATDYTYDANGNLISDANKKISGIVYNILNLPQRITQTGKGTISYIYDAAGNKLQKKTLQGGVTITTTYLESSIYQNDTLQFFGTPQGRVRPVGSSYVYDYYLKDHLGNTRMVITDDYNVASPILEVNSYYPFGLEQKAISVTQILASKHNKYKYNGKELQEDLGLDQYDYGARFYDPQIARWHIADPLAEKGRRWSPYNYAADNPLRFIDPDGMESVTYSGAAAVNAFKQLKQMADVEGWGKDKGDGDDDDKKKKRPKYHIREYTLSEHHPGFWERLKNSKNIVARVFYSTIDDIYVTGQLFIDRSNKQHLGGGWANPNDATRALVGTVTTGLAFAGGEVGEAAKTEQVAVEGAAKGGSTGFRYMTEGELQAIQETGMLRGGNPGKTYFTKDLYKSGINAQQRLSLPTTPTMRVEFEILNNPTMKLNGSKVLPDFGMPGKGAEFMTTDPVRVRLINWQHLR